MHRVCNIVTDLRAGPRAAKSCTGETAKSGDFSTHERRDPPGRREVVKGGKRWRDKVGGKTQQEGAKS